MADLRGGLASVHRSPGASPPEPVTLQQPRPDLQRVANEYVETPLRPDVRTSGGSVVPRRHRVVTGQPVKKDCAAVPGPSSGECSIICGECGKCRCEACRRPRPLPSIWLCRNFCICSTESCVDYGSCLCCVKGLMYHCSSSDGDDDTCADDPCSCGPERRAGRWACMALAALPLPCLLCYWPLRGTTAAAQALYSRWTDRACRCDHSTSLTPEKRLLHSTSTP